MELRGTNEADRAIKLIELLHHDVNLAQDKLWEAKVSQTHTANVKRSKEDVFHVGNRVMLSTKNRRNEYKKKGEKCVAKFFPRFDGPYTVKDAFPETSNYRLELPPDKNGRDMFHASQLKRHNDNDPKLFPDREYARPGPIMTSDGLEEFLINKIVDLRKRSCGHQYLIRWHGYGPEHDEWLPARELEDCEALDRWFEVNGVGPDAR
jgi:hypothetical protein